MKFLSKWLIAAAATVTLGSALAAYDGTNGPGIPNGIWEKGEYLSHVPHGGRMVTFHRGYFYVMGQESTSLWDLSDPVNPAKIDEVKLGDNGHRWFKLNGDTFWREYSVPEIAGSGYRFIDMSDMLDIKPWSDASIPVPITDSGDLFVWQALATFPTGITGNNVHDHRYSDYTQNTGDLTSTFSMENSGISSSFLNFRIGNLMFIMGNGVAVFDIGDPENIHLLDSLTGEFNQYTTTYHIWRNYVVFLNGANDNKDNNNLVMIDFSDPTDLKYTGGVPFAKSPGRYIHFQDKYGFAGSADYGVKLNMETLEVEQRIEAPGPWPDTFLDFQWIPLGSLLAISGSNGLDSKTFFYSHQTGADTKGPEIGFHHPFANATEQPISTVIGFVINEVLEERTLTTENIQLRKAGSTELIDGDIVNTSYQTVNFVPKVLLEENETYTVTLIQNGIKDVAGNGVDEFSFSFSTGSDIVSNLPPQIDSISYGSTDPVNINAEVTFTALAVDNENEAMFYSWDLGAGYGTFSSTATITHSYDTAGVYPIKVRVKDEAENVSTFVSNIVVVEQVSDTKPKQSSQLALNASLTLLAAVNPDNNSVSLINTQNRQLIAEIAVCTDPVSITTVGDTFWLACRDDDQIDIIDASTQVVSRSINLSYGAKPIALLAAPNEELVYVAEMGSGAITALNVIDFSVVAREIIGTTPRALAINSDGSQLYVSRFISTADQAVVWALDPTTLNVFNTIELSVDTTSLDTSTGGRGVPNYLSAIAIHPSNNEAVVVGKKDNIVRGMNRDGLPLNFENSVRSVIAKLDLTTASEQLDSRIDIDNHAQPSAAVFDQFGNYLFVAMQGNNRVLVMNPNTGQELARVEVEFAPQALLLDSDNQQLYVKNFLSRSISVIDVGTLLTQGTGDLILQDHVNTVSTERLSANILQGKQVFYNAADTRMGLDGYLACATCHMDGGQDGQVWDFTNRGEGLRNTISLKGRAGIGHGRVHWSANFDEIHDFEHDMRGAFNGTGFIAQADFNAGTVNQPLGDTKAGLSATLDALAAYVTSLEQYEKSAHRQASGELTAQAQLGAQLFVNAQCANCHAGATFTDSPQGFMHDVGTINLDSGNRLGQSLTALDTPTLRDLSTTAPYLHNGSVNELSALFGSSNAHGSTATFTNLQISQLVAYLLQIDQAEPPAPNSTLQLALTGLSNGMDLDNDNIPLSVTTNLNAITKVEYYANGALVESVENTPYTTLWSPVETGAYRLQAKVFYNQGQTASTTPEITVYRITIGSCSVSFDIVQQWEAGYQVDIAINNLTDDMVAGYQLTYNLGVGETISSGWNANVVTTDQAVTVTNSANHWNGTIPANGSIHFGYQAEKSQAVLSVPNNFVLNGKSCVVTNLPPIDPDEPPVSDEPLQLALTDLSDGMELASDTTLLRVTTNISGITKVEYYANDVLVESVESAPYTTLWHPTELGVYKLQAKVFYNQGQDSSTTPDISVQRVEATSCSVGFDIAQQWQGGYQINVTISNLTDDIVAGYELMYSLGAGESIASSWNAGVITNGQAITVINPASHWNGIIPANGSASFGYQVDQAQGVLNIPNDVVLNGQSCLVIAP